MTLCAQSEQLSGVGGAATVRTSVRLPKPKAPRKVDITSVIREALGPIAPTLAREQIIVHLSLPTAFPTMYLTSNPTTILNVRLM